MTRICPKCGSDNIEEAKYCNNCGYNLNSKNKSDAFDISNIFKNGKVFIILIALVLVVGGIFILTSTQNNTSVNNVPTTNIENDVPTTNEAEIEMIITEASAHKIEYSTDPDEYNLVTYAMFQNIPDSLEGYLLKTTYYDKDNNKIGSVTEKLSSALVEDNYVDDEDTYYFGDYSSYKKIIPSYVIVELTKNGELVTNGTCDFDENKINYLAG